MSAHDDYLDPDIHGDRHDEPSEPDHVAIELNNLVTACKARAVDLVWNGDGARTLGEIKAKLVEEFGQGVVDELGRRLAEQNEPMQHGCDVCRVPLAQAGLCDDCARIEATF